MALSAVLLLARQCHSYCWQAGKNPGFSAPPKVFQLSMDRVLVSWEGLVTKENCADNYVVKYWQRAVPSDYRVTDIVDKGKYEVEIIVVPKVPYQFQAVAREEKGMIGGVDWNKSPTATFQTSSINKVTPPPQSGSKSKSLFDSSATTTRRPPKPREEDDGDKVLGLSMELFVAAVIAALLLLLIIVGLIYRCACGGKNYDSDSEEGSDDEDDSDDEDSDSGSSSEDEKEDLRRKKNIV